jgi:ABC-type nitrate/sulfonate/bicarbonate transport system ATPase subunit
MVSAALRMLLMEKRDRLIQFTDRIMALITHDDDEVALLALEAVVAISGADGKGQ